MGTAAATGWAEWMLAAGGWALLTVGGMLLLWALFWDRSRGRKRCPKCWYDMGGAVARQEESGREVFTCPECGRRVKGGERGLRKTRRRWGWAVCAVALLAGSYAAMSAPGVRARGWWAALPRPVLILAVPWVEDVLVGQYPRRACGPLEHEIRHRLGALGATYPELWFGERLLLRSVSKRAFERTVSESAECLAADLLARYSDDAYDIVNESGKCRVALAKSRLLYARCSSYRDKGLVRGSNGVRDEQPFVMAFARSGAFRLELLLHPIERNFSMRYVIWGTEPAINHWWTLGNNRGPSTTILGALGGPGCGSTYAIATQLIHAVTWPTPMNSPALIGSETFDGRECIVIRNWSVVMEAQDVWLDRENFAVRKIREYRPSPSVTVFRPEFDVVMDKEEFEFDPVAQGPSRLGDGEAVCNELRALAGDPKKDAVPSP